jgi:hypothetical protein
MHNRRAISVSFGWAILAICFSASITRACVIVPETFGAGREFQVRVTDWGRPVKGLRMVLSTQSSARTKTKVVKASLTDAEGYAHFSHLSVGSFWLSADHDGGIGEAVVVYVSPNGPANATLYLSWPHPAPLSVRSASGMLRDQDYYPNQEQAPFSISLLEGISGREIEKTQTDIKGRFKFTTETPAGIYFIRLNPTVLRGPSDRSDGGMIVIEVNHEAKLEALDLDLGWTDCGLSYVEREKQPELNLDKICGVVTDSEGGVVSNAQVILLAEGDDTNVLERTQTGTQGQFTFPDQRDGIYELLVKSAGFQSFLVPIHVKNTGTLESCRPTPIRLAVI